MGTSKNKLTYLTETKEALKTAIINKGVSISEKDTFRSYPEKINNIKGNETITKAFLPPDFKGETRAGKKFLINPKSYYQSVTSDYQSGEFTLDTNCNSYAIPFENIIAYHYSYGATDIIVRDETGSYPTNLNKHYSHFSSKCRLATQLIPDALIISDINYTYLCTYDSQTNSLVNTTFTDAHFAKGRTLTLYDTVNEAPIFLDKNTNIMYSYSPAGTSDNWWSITKWDLSNYTQGPVKMNNNGNGYAFSSQYQGLFLPESDKTVAYVLSNGNTYKITNLTGPSAKASYSRIYISTNPLTSVKQGTQMLDGLYSFIIADNALWIYKRHQDTEGDYYWEYDEEKTTFFTGIIGNYLGEKRYYFLPQIDNTVYVQVNNFVFGFQYHKETDTFEQIEHPCASLIEALPQEEKENDLLYTYVNKVNGLASISKKNNTTGFASVMTFSIDEKPNLENIYWVAYEPKRTNYITQSITAISTGTTGTDENGNNYLEVKRLAESNDLGDHLPGPQDPSHETETGGDKESSLK